MIRCGSLVIVTSACSVAGAEIVHVEFTPPVVVPASPGTAEFDLDSDGVDDVGLFITFVEYHSTGVTPRSGALLLDPVSFLLLELAPDEVIGPEAFFDPSPSLLDSAGSGKGMPALDWSDSGAYLGLYFPSDDGVHYAWMRVGSVLGDGSPQDPTLLTLYSFAYENEPGAPIAAGAVPGPGSLAALALAAAVGARRRRES